MTSADTPRTDADEQLRAKIERIIGTAILKNDKNYTNGIMALIKADREQAVVEARIEERKHTWKLINDVRYKKVSLDFAKEVSLERLSTLEAEQDIKRIDALTAPSTAKGDKPE